MEENIFIKGTLGLNYSEVSSFDVPTSDWEGSALLLNLHFFETTIEEGSSHAEVYFPSTRLNEIIDLLGKDVIVEGDYLGDETRGYINNPPIVKKKLIIAKNIRQL